MEQAVDRMIGAAGINIEGLHRDLGGAKSMERLTSEIREAASDIVKEKLLQSRGAPVAITWKDIYDLRGTVSARACNEGLRLYCISSFTDAVGSGLMGNVLGRGIKYVGLAFAGPAGFIIESGMSITQETFQCTPDAVTMALDAGAGVVILLPWCKAPGVKEICARAGQFAEKATLTIVERNHGREVAIAAGRMLGSESGGMLVRVIVEHLNAHGKEAVTNAVTHQIHSDIVPGDASKVNVPEPVPPQPLRSH
jgi:hypothetical protein